jgi:hypothetical protein
MSKILSFQNSINYDKTGLDNMFNSNIKIYPTTRSIPVPIPQSTSKSDLQNYNLYNDTFDNYFRFNLKIVNNNDNEQMFSSHNNKEYANLIKTHHRIEFNNLKKYEINIFHKEQFFILKGEINNNLSTFVDKNENIFIEFSQDCSGNTDCTCYFLKKNIDSLCISPPN